MIINLITKEIYIGSSNSIYYRIARHKSMLKTKSHPNNRLQEGWNINGEISFTIQILERCDRNSLLEREQYYMDILKPTYNISLDAINNTPSENSKLQISNTLKEKYKSGEIDCYRQEHLWRIVEQYNIQGNLVSTYKNPVEAATIMNCHRNSILNACKDYSWFVLGFQWKYQDSNKTIYNFSNKIVLIKKLKVN